MANEYECSWCSGTFAYDPDWSDEDAKQEAEDNFPSTPIEDMDLVCDDCYRKVFGSRG